MKVLGILHRGRRSGERIPEDGRPAGNRCASYVLGSGNPVEREGDGGKERPGKGY